MKILFISRAYPPITGGIENQNFELSQWLAKIDGISVTTIINPYGKKFLPIFLPYATLKAILLAPSHDIVLLGDGVLGITSWFVKLFHAKTKVASVVHGLDLTYKLDFYQNWWLIKFIPTIDRLIAVGNETIRAGVRLGLDEKKFIFIPNGIDTEKFAQAHTRADLSRVLKGESVEGKRYLLTSGRLAKRKGVAWFVRNVLPKLPENIVYVVAGDGADKENILAAIQETNLGDRVRMLGYVTDEERNILMNTCDLFIQANIKIEGDMEGFGISVIEAASSGIPVLASRLEGLQDAIKDGEDGFLIEPENAQAYIDKITELLAQGEPRDIYGAKFRQYVVDHYHWRSVSKRYAEILQQVINEN